MCPGWCGVIVGQDWKVSGNLPTPPTGQVALFCCQLLALCLLCMVVPKLTPPPYLFLYRCCGSWGSTSKCPQAPVIFDYLHHYCILTLSPTAYFFRGSHGGGWNPPPLVKMHLEVSEANSFLHSHWYIYKELRSKRICS